MDAKLRIKVTRGMFARIGAGGDKIRKQGVGSSNQFRNQSRRSRKQITRSGLKMERLFLFRIIIYVLKSSS